MFPAFPGRIGMGDDAELQAIPLETVIARGLAGVVERSRIAEASQDIEILGIVHGMDPDAVLVALVLDVATGKEAAREVPVADLAVHRHGTRRRQDLDAQVLGFRRRCRPGCTQTETRQRENDPPFHETAPLGP